MAKKGKIYFLTSYIEYLLGQEIKSEEYYLGDASRFLRFLLGRVETADIRAFMESAAPGYERRLRKTLRKFYTFAETELGISNDPLDQM